MSVTRWWTTRLRPVTSSDLGFTRTLSLILNFLIHEWTLSFKTDRVRPLVLPIVRNYRRALDFVVPHTSKEEMPVRRPRLPTRMWQGH